MQAGATRRRTTQPIIEAWNAVKGLDYNDKLELVTMLIESVKPVATHPLKRYTMKEINAMIDEAEAEIAAGKGIPDEEVWRKYDEEFAREEKDTLEMA